MSDSELVPVTQADRERALLIWGELGPFRKGEINRLAQAFACCRADAEAASEAQVKVFREALEAYLAWGSVSPAQFERQFPQFAKDGVKAIDSAARTALSKEGEE